MLLGYEPGELPDCSTPQHWRLPLLSGILQTGKAARLNITHVSCRGQALSSSPQNARNSKKRIEGSGFRCEAQQFGETDWRGRCGDAVQSTAKPYARFVTNRLPKRARSPAMAVIDVHAHISVSYTHLDVYKRQSRICCGCARPRWSA